ncbi:hypothetical protein HS088_TW08G00600 [Tripterygium wilfordii]|uniref:Uncharacterized protein n=1 Tax=Tripterygium wilfordii TaxID=458696 RepID=A0A7J7DCC7_TRIWF|nr:hypothetical protein HS088_TW08G00600 [Tripterygium wilfordii]
MNAYSRMRSVRASKSRSMDFSSSDLAASLPPEESSNPTTIHANNGQIKNPPQDQEGVVMKVNRAFSMRRSSSVSERYCRIHDQPLDSASPFNTAIDEYDDDGTLERTRSVKRNKKSSSRGKILKACKKLLGL